MAIAASADYSESKQAIRRHQSIALTLAVFIGPWLGFLYLGHGRLALRYLAYSLGVLTVFSLLYLADFSFLAFMPYKIFYLLLVHVAGAAHCANREAAPTTRKAARFHRHLALALVLPTLGAAFGLYQAADVLSDRMRGPAMAPTIGLNAPYFINRLAYRGALPRRGDVVIYTTPDKQGPITRISRIIGLPGERIAMRLGVPVINGQTASVTRLADYRDEEGVAVVEAPSFLETLPDGTRYRVLSSPAPGTGRYDNHPERQVPPGAYFVIGDNRGASRDSRDIAGVGFVRMSQIEGAVFNVP